MAFREASCVKAVHERSHAGRCGIVRSRRAAYFLPDPFRLKAKNHNHIRVYSKLFPYAAQDSFNVQLLTAIPVPIRTLMERSLINA